MKRIISGYIFDTHTAELVCDVVENKKNNSLYINAQLFAKPRANEARRFFLAGFGGSLTAFARSNHDGSMRESEKIVVITEEEAYNFAKEYATQEAIFKYF